jgi:hypothetical protein
MDNTFREEMYKVFINIQVRYTRDELMNDNFSYDTDFDRIYDRLASMLQDNLYYYSKGQIVENVVRMTEILNLDSDVLENL